LLFDALCQLIFFVISFCYAFDADARPIDFFFFIDFDADFIVDTDLRAMTMPMLDYI